MRELYPLVLDDAGCNLSSHPREFNDCTVRAFAIVTGLPYDQVWRVLQRAGRKANKGFHSDRWLVKRKGKAFGGLFRPIETKGYQDRYSMCPPLTPLNFARCHSKGRFILEHDDHTWAFLDGKHHDLWRVKQDKPLSGAWEFTT